MMLGEFLLSKVNYKRFLRELRDSFVIENLSARDRLYVEE